MALFGASMVFFGCAVTKPVYNSAYQPIEIESAAKGVTIAHTTPYNCKILGEAQGKDDATQKDVASVDKVRDGALNDLKNNALAVAGSGKRIMLSITNEEAQCTAFFVQKKFFGLSQKLYKKDVDCTKGYSGATWLQPLTYTVKAQIFECGNKD